jgi:hypothetical protein
MRTLGRLNAWRIAAAALVLSTASGAARAQQENPTTPGAIPNPGSYQGSLALQQQEQQQTQQRLNQTYSPYAPSGGGAGRRGPPPPNLWDKPPLPPAKNPLLGRWRQGAHRDAAPRQFGDGVASFVNGAMAGGCDSIFGKGVVAFEPDALQWVAPDGHEEILNHVSYRAVGAGDVAVLTRDPGALPAMFIGLAGHDHAVVAMLNCTLERVGAQRTALTSTPAQRAAPGPAPPLATGNMLTFSVGVGGGPLANARVWITRENPALPLARGGLRGVDERAPLDSLWNNCGVPLACGQALRLIGETALASAKTDASGQAQAPSPGPGRYYVVAMAPVQTKAILWAMPVDLKPGANAVRLDASNGRAIQ